MSDLEFPDTESLADLQRFATLARQVDADAALRLLAVGEVLATYACVVPGRGLTGAGAVLGLRTYRLGAPHTVDVTVPAAAVLDRIARVAGSSGTSLPIPPMSAFVAWAAVSPPCSGWTPAGSLDSTLLLETARTGITALGSQGSGMAAALESARAQVWSGPIAGTEAPAGLAFGAYALRFLTPGGEASLWRSGAWWRLSTPAGHVLAH